MYYTLKKDTLNTIDEKINSIFLIHRILHTLSLIVLQL
jgi:hypothetical protein